MIELINRARLDPAAEAARLGIDLNEGLDGIRISTSSYQPLALNAHLTEAADSHSAWMLETETISHTGAEGSDTGDRILATGLDIEDSGTWSENISFRASSGTLDQTSAIIAQHRSLFDSALHRLNMFRAAASEVGIGQATGDFGGYDASLITQNFVSNKLTAFLTGVAYVDRDGDDFYSVGEGRGGIDLHVAGSSGVTASAGGYAIAVGATGFQTIRAETAAGTLNMKVNFKGENIKLDLIGNKGVAASGDLTLLSGLTSGKLLGTNNLYLTGNTVANTLEGNSGDNKVFGGGGSDRIAGEGGNDLLRGEDGEDRITGGAGHDSMWGGLGDDTIFGGDGADVLRGGVGFDIADYGQSTAGVDVSLARGTGFYGAAQGDQLYGIDGVVGSDFKDVLTGNDGRNLLVGGGGGDILIGLGGGDTLLGGDGDDRFESGHGGDVIRGGAGYDLVDYTDAAGGVIVYLDGRSATGGYAAGDQILQVEGVIGSDFADRLYGDAADNWLEGGWGSDQMQGGGGADTFVFGFNSGHDTILDFDTGADLLKISSEQLGAGGLADILITEKHGDTVLTLADGSTITLLDVASAGDLSSYIQII